VSTHPVGVMDTARRALAGREGGSRGRIQPRCEGRELQLRDHHLHLARLRRRPPRPLPGYDPHTGRKTWDPATVRTLAHPPPGQGARTDLTHHPGTDGQPVFINSTTVTTATLLHDLAGTHPTTIPKTALKQGWAQQFADNYNPPVPQPVPRAPTTRQITKALDALHKLGAIHHDRHHITITNHAILADITTL
jgi:hypothetical protein